MDKHFNEFSFKVIHCFKPIPHCQWKKSSVDWHWVGSLYWWYTDFPPPSQSWMGCLVKVFSASTSLPLILPMVPQALWAGHRGHGSDLQVCTHNSISLVSILLDINSIDLSYWKVSNNFTSPSFLWIIVHIYVLTQIKNDGDLRMQRFAKISLFWLHFPSQVPRHPDGLVNAGLPGLPGVRVNVGGESPSCPLPHPQVSLLSQFFPLRNLPPPPSLATIAGYWLWFLYLKYLKMESEASKEVTFKMLKVVESCNSV